MRQATQKFEVSFVWIKLNEGYKWENSVQCSHWGEPFDTMNKHERKKFEDEISSATAGPFLVEKQPSLARVPYYPLENPALFAQFSDIAPTEESFIQWADEYGRLIDIESNKEFTHTYILSPFIPRSEENLESVCSCGRYRITERNGQYYLISKPDPLNLWKFEHRDLSFAVMLWELASNNDPRLNGIMEWHEDTRRVYAYTFPKEKLEEIDFERFGKDEKYSPNFISPPRRIENYFPQRYDVKKAALRYVLQEAIRKLSFYPLGFELQIDEKEQINKILKPGSLLSAMWYQLFLAATGEIKLKRCSICGRWENMEGHRESWSKHANCANYDRVKRARKKKQGRAI